MSRRQQIQPQLEKNDEDYLSVREFLTKPVIDHLCLQYRLEESRREELHSRSKFFTARDAQFTCSNLASIGEELLNTVVETGRYSDCFTAGAFLLAGGLPETAIEVLRFGLDNQRFTKGLISERAAEVQARDVLTTLDVLKEELPELIRECAMRLKGDDYCTIGKDVIPGSDAFTRISKQVRMACDDRGIGEELSPHHILWFLEAQPSVLYACKRRLFDDEQYWRHVTHRHLTRALECPSYDTAVQLRRYFVRELSDMVESSVIINHDSEDLRAVIVYAGGGGAQGLTAYNIRGRGRVIVSLHEETGPFSDSVLKRMGLKPAHKEHPRECWLKKDDADVFRLYGDDLSKDYEDIAAALNSVGSRYEFKAEWPPEE